MAIHRSTFQFHNGKRSEKYQTRKLTSSPLCLVVVVVVVVVSNKFLYLHDRIILQYCKSMYMTIKI